jgi:hypothetical protein
MSRRPATDPRNDVSMAEHVEQALQIVKREGVGPELAFMETAGVPHLIAIRVLTSPTYIRSRERRNR